GCIGCELLEVCYPKVQHDKFDGVNPGFSPEFEIVTLYPGRTDEHAKNWRDLTYDPRASGPHPKPWLADYPRCIFDSDEGDVLSECRCVRRSDPVKVDKPGVDGHPRLLWRIASVRVVFGGVPFDLLA